MDHFYEFLTGEMEKYISIVPFHVLSIKISIKRRLLDGVRSESLRALLRFPLSCFPLNKSYFDQHSQSTQ